MCRNLNDDLSRFFTKSHECQRCGTPLGFDCPFDRYPACATRPWAKLLNRGAVNGRTAHGVCLLLCAVGLEVFDAFAVAEVPKTLVAVAILFEIIKKPGER